MNEFEKQKEFSRQHRNAMMVVHPESLPSSPVPERGFYFTRSMYVRSIVFTRIFSPLSM